MLHYRFLQWAHDMEFGVLNLVNFFDSLFTFGRSSGETRPRLNSIFLLRSPRRILIKFFTSFLIANPIVSVGRREKQTEITAEVKTGRATPIFESERLTIAIRFSESLNSSFAWKNVFFMKLKTN